MANKIILKKSSVASKVPLATDLDVGEIAVNLADQKLYSKNASGTVILVGSNATGTVTSVGMTVPTGLTVSGSPVTTSGTLAVTLTAGYSIPTTASQTNWDSAYTQRLQWDGGSTNLVAATGRTSLGGTTVGQNFFTLTNPAAITFPRINADNTVSALDAATFRTAIGAGTGSGTVTGVTATAPVASSGGTAPVISLASGYGDTQNPFASKTANYVLAAPNGVAGAPTFRAIVAADIPTLNQNTTGSSGSCTGNSATATTATNQSGGTVAATTGSFSGQITSTVVTGTAPMVIASTTKVANLNVEQVDGYHADTANTASTIAVRDASKNLALSGVVLSGSTSGTTTLIASAAAGTTTATLPATTGTIITTGDTGTVTNTMLAGSIANAKLANSSVTVTAGTGLSGGGAIALGSSATVSLATAYGDTQNPYASKTANYVLAAPNGTAGAPTFRAIVAADIPTLNQNTTGSSGSCTGNAATATTSSRLATPDTRNTTIIPTDLSAGLVTSFQTNTSDGLSDGGTYNGLWSFRQYGSSTDWSGGVAHQLGFTDNGNIWHRIGNSATWGTWNKLLDSANYNSYAPTLTGTGASGTWGIGISGNAATATSAATLTTARTLTIGSTGKTFNGSANVSWTVAEIGTVVGGAGGSIVETVATISANYSITSGSNGLSAGPISINSGVTVTIPSGSTWAIV